MSYQHRQTANRRRGKRARQSQHCGVANFLFGDGSVHFLNYSIGDGLLKLATRAGREVVSGEW